MSDCDRTDPHACLVGRHLPTPTCDRCGAPDPIRGEGEATLVCERCLRALGRIAGEPFSASDAVRLRLLHNHGDVLDLDGAAWAWTPDWPDAGDHRLTGRAT